MVEPQSSPASSPAATPVEAPDSLLTPGARVFVAGHRGLVGSAIRRRLDAEGFDVLVRTRDELDLRNSADTADFLAQTRPDAVVLAAAKVGGIMANSTYPVQFLEDNLRIQLSVISGSHAAGVGRLLFLGSSCIYPKLAPQPIQESSILTGPLEKTNQAYALAKIAGIEQVNAYRSQYGASYISAMPTNLYGPGDNFDLASSHVLPALIRRFHEAKQAGAASVTLWGTGTPLREFLHVDDLADASLLLLRSYDGPESVNVGCGEDLSIADLAGVVSRVVGFQGEIAFDPSKPDGTPRKLLSIGKLSSLGWKPKIDLEDGIRSTYEWWQSQSQAA
jgi:GDP-L-fucose synthase